MSILTYIAGWPLLAALALIVVPRNYRVIIRAIAVLATFIRAHDFLAAVADWIDRWILEGAIIGAIRGGTDLSGRALRLAQTGNLQTYTILFVLGVVLLLYFVLGK